LGLAAPDRSGRHASGTRIGASPVTIRPLNTQV